MDAMCFSNAELMLTICHNTTDCKIKMKDLHRDVLRVQNRIMQPRLNNGDQKHRKTMIVVRSPN